MKQKTLIISLLIVLSILVSSSAIAQSTAPNSPADISAAVGTTFTYQGFLSESGNPANGSYNFTFELHDHATSVSQVGSDVVKTGVSVSDGYFTVELDFGSQFDGTALWLDIQVQKPGDAGYTTLTPRQPLNAAPYALYALDVGSHDHFGDLWSSSSTTNYGLKVHNTATTGSKGGIYGETSSSTGRGVFGSSLATSGSSAGVVGSSDVSPTGRGVWGTGFYAIYGETWRNDGYGVYGEAMASTGTSYGVYGESNSSNGYGGYFVNSGSDGVALYAEGSGSGRNDATLRVDNTAATQGAAAYITADTDTAAVHFLNEGSGEVLYLRNGSVVSTGSGGGDFIRALNETETDVQFRVSTSGSVYTDGDVRAKGEVYADGGYNCGQSFNDTLLVGGAPPTFGQNESSISPCLMDDSPADFAEMLPALGDLEPGDVLAIGSDGNLIQSTEPFQTTVIGIRSTRPSFLGNARFADKDGYAPLAMLGVVPVKASAENGAIQPGDLLVSSLIPGHAMRAGDNPPQGTVIGKALEPLDEGTGIISIVVTLQ